MMFRWGNGLKTIQVFKNACKRKKALLEERKKIEQNIFRVTRFSI